MMSQNTLFIICPDCYIEHKIRNQFPGSHFFLTGLGGIIDSSDSGFIDSIKFLIEQEKVTKTCIINDPTCRFINSVVKKEKGYLTKAEGEIRDILLKYPKDLLLTKDIKSRTYILAKLNIQEQIKKLWERFYADYHIVRNNIKIEGYIYDRSENNFSIVCKKNIGSTM